MGIKLNIPPILMVGIVVGALSIGTANGWLVNGWRLGKKIERIEKEHAKELADANAKVLAAINQKLGEVTALGRRNSQVAENLANSLESGRRKAAEETKELKHAIGQSTARACNIPVPWRVLADKHARITRKHAAAAAAAGFPVSGPGGSSSAAYGGLRSDTRAPVSCAAMSEFSDALLDSWDILATRCRSLQVAVRQREEYFDRVRRDMGTGQ